MRMRVAAASALALLGLSACGSVPVGSSDDPSEEPALTRSAAPSEPALTASTPTPSTPTPSTPTTFAETLDQVASGVVMVRATTCGGTGLGTGFLVAPGRIVTAAHVVEGAASVAIVQAGAVLPAAVVGVDVGHDLAMLSTQAMDGHVFTMAPGAPPAGTAVAVVGHPLGEPLTITEGNVSRVDQALWPNLQLDVSVSPGNSGGPVVTVDGSVVGLLVSKDVEANGLAYALRPDVATPYIRGNRALAPPVQPACSSPLGPSDAELPAPASVLERAVARTFTRYFGGINSGDYWTAYQQRSPRLRSGYEAFADGVSTSYDFAFEVRSLTPTATGAAVWLRFVSLQEPAYGPDGEGCTQWSIDYQLVWNATGQLRIDHARGHSGSDGHRPCE